ncbi:unnamed protein product, partial [Ectocarpus sp. 12 AP-2014]
QLEIKDRKEQEEERLAAHKKKRSDEKSARRATLLSFWGKAQHELRDEAHARSVAREKTVQDRVRGAADALRSEDSLRKAARHEDQTAGPWGFEKVQADHDEGATGGKSKTRRAFQAPGPVGSGVGAVDS